MVLHRPSQISVDDASTNDAQCRLLALSSHLTRVWCGRLQLQAQPGKHFRSVPHMQIPRMQAELTARAACHTHTESTSCRGRRASLHRIKSTFRPAVNPVSGCLKMPLRIVVTLGCWIRLHQHESQLATSLAGDMIQATQIILAGIRSCAAPMARQRRTPKQDPGKG
jgi:hypothetical protein